MSSNNGSSLQSIRSSCDRCRLQKLKCNSLATDSAESAEGPAPCERCNRAKVRCVYGRRRRANRHSNLSVGTRGPGQDASISATPSPVASMTSPTALDFQLTPENHSWDELLAAHQPWDNLIFELHDTSPGVTSSDHQDCTGWDWARQELGLENACTVDVEALESTSSQLTGGSMAIATDSKPTNVPANQRFVTLVADIEDRQKMLEQWPRPHDNSQSLDDYPVGAVLHLYQEFSGFAGQVLNHPGQTRINSALCKEIVAGREMKSIQVDEEPGVDTASTLLVLYGYIGLMRMYSTVFGHFQTYLERIPAGADTRRGISVGNASTRPTLQLSELPCASTVSYLGRIHTAVGMLLTTLHSVEELLGQGGGVARNLVLARLTQESLLRSSEVPDGYGGLAGKVGSVNNLLREKMGL